MSLFGIISFLCMSRACESPMEKGFLKEFLVFVLPVILFTAFPASSQTSLKKQPTKSHVSTLLATKAYAEATELLAQSKPELAARKYQEAATHWQTPGDRVSEAKALRG